ncbi:hypothetical protein M0R45_036632 [Rubus argutus]|uniref:Uncharacterized protein n=1 Tax=Rubus argutus TaxID=59490 RepID=A0AAW1W245_RUBAR
MTTSDSGAQALIVVVGGLQVIGDGKQRRGRSRGGGVGDGDGDGLTQKDMVVASKDENDRKFFKYQSCPPSRPLCLAQSNQGSDFNFVLHDALDSSGTLTYHARGFRRTNARHLYETRAIFVHSVLTHGSVSIATREITQDQSIVFRSFMLMLLGVKGKERDRSLLLFTLLDVISQLVEGP